MNMHVHVHCNTHTKHSLVGRKAQQIMKTHMIVFVKMCYGGIENIHILCTYTCTSSPILSHTCE